MNRTELNNKYCVNCVKARVCKFNPLDLPDFIFIDYCGEYYGVTNNIKENK